MKEESQLNREITIRFLMKYALPTMIAMIVFSTFGIIDGVFASRGISPEAFAAIARNIRQSVRNRHESVSWPKAEIAMAER